MTAQPVDFAGVDEQLPSTVFRKEQAAREIAAIREAKAFKIWTPAEIWKPLEPPDYLFDGLLVRGSLSLLCAYGSSLKTWVAADGTISVSTGTPWMGRFPTKPGKALFIDFESGDYELRRRVHRIAKGRELPIPIENFGMVTMPAWSLAEDGFFEALAPLAKEHAFIAIDSLAAGSAGIDENDSRFATSLQRLKAIAAESGCVVLVLHHARKGNGAEGSDEREMVRGTSAIFNACDCVMQLSRAKDEGAFLLRQTKARGGKSVEPFVVRVDDIGEDASVVSASNAPEPGDGECLGKAKAIDKLKRAVLLLLSTEKGLTSKNQICARVTGTKKTTLDAIAELIETDLIREHDGAWRLSSEVGP